MSQVRLTSSSSGRGRMTDIFEGAGRATYETGPFDPDRDTMTADLIAASDHPYEAGSHYERALRLAKQIDKRGQQLTELLDHVCAQVR